MNADEPMTPEQLETKARMDALALDIGKVLNGKPMDVAVGALLNAVGRVLQMLHGDKNEDLLMRAALGLEKGANVAAEMVASVRDGGGLH